MPVPDQVRDDGSGIPATTVLLYRWIPGQARNDELYHYPPKRFCPCEGRDAAIIRTPYNFVVFLHIAKQR